MYDNPMSTIATNSLGRGQGDTALRDMVGDSSSNAMNTHIGNHQGLTSNVQSDYNKNNMTDIQKNMQIIDVARGYGQEDGGYSNQDSIYSVGHSLEESHNDYQSTDLYSQSAHNMSSNSSMQSPSLSMQSPSLSMQSPSLSMQSPMMVEEGVMELGSSLYTKKQNEKPKYIDKSLNSDKDKNKKKIQAQVQAMRKSTTAEDGTKEKDKTEANKGIEQKSNRNNSSEATEDELIPKKEKTTSSTLLRPVVVPRTVDLQTHIKSNSVTKKDILKDKLSKMTEPEFIKLLEKISNESQKENHNEIITMSKIALLKSEAIRRHRH